MAAKVHSREHGHRRLKASRLISVKTGGCSEDCAYCAQSYRYRTHVGRAVKLDKDACMQLAKKAKDSGLERVCLSASQRQVSDEDFTDYLNIIKGIRDMGMDVCCTLGIISEEKIARLRDAGVKAYNHNLDSSERYYPNIISTRTYRDRLDTIKGLINQGMPWCSGGIIGLGEGHDDRIDMICTLASQKVAPYTVPLNMLVPIEGTPMAEMKAVPAFDMVRMIACLRVLLPKTMIALAAGRAHMNQEAQALCFLSGVNSIFSGEQLLTTPNPDPGTDADLMNKLGLELG